MNQDNFLNDKHDHEHGDENAKPVGGILDKKDALRFIFAGNCKITIKNTKTGTHFTYHIREQENARNCTSLFYVSLLTGPEQWSYFGFIRDANYVHGKKDKTDIGETAESVRYFKSTLSLLALGTLPDHIEVWHEGRCVRCGRTLTDTSSIERGIGPMCLSMLNKDTRFKSVMDKTRNNDVKNSLNFYKHD